PRRFRGPISAQQSIRQRKAPLRQRGNTSTEDSNPSVMAAWRVWRLLPSWPHLSWRAGLPIRGGDADAGCGLAVAVVTACRKNPLPTPLALGIRILALDGMGERPPPVPVARSRSCRALTL